MSMIRKKNAVPPPNVLKSGFPHDHRKLGLCGKSLRNDVLEGGHLSEIICKVQAVSYVIYILMSY